MSRLLAALVMVLAAHAQVKEVRTIFEVRYVATDAVYLNGGSEEGLQEGMQLTLKRVAPGEPALAARIIGRLLVTATTAHSAVCTLEAAGEEVKPGDSAQISREDLDALQIIQQSKTARRFAQVVAFTDDDALAQELRDYIPKPPSPAVNQARGRVSYELTSIADHFGGFGSLQHGVVVRIDATRLGGTFWNLTGYWRGRVNNSLGPSSQVTTIRDLLNRTYQIGMFYTNPQSRYTIGAGRLYVPWVVGLGTLDGAYIGRAMGGNTLRRHLTLAAFAGSTPDPTAWNYKPNRQIAGTLVNLELGNFENVRFSAAAGMAMTRLSWKAEREFAFTQSSFSWGQHFSVYHNLEADRLTVGRLGNTESGPALSRSFVTARIQPAKWISFDLNHNYFRTVPTFDLLLVGTGALDRYLFSGTSGGLRLELPKQWTLYGNVGRSKRNDDNGRSLNQMYGIGFRNVFDTGVRVDVRRSVFNGAFGRGWYQSVSFAREIGSSLRFEVTGGEQEFRSGVSNDNRGLFMNSTVDWFVGRHYVLGGGVNVFRGQLQSYDQTYFSLGYRF